MGFHASETSNTHLNRQKRLYLQRAILTASLRLKKSEQPHPQLELSEEWKGAPLDNSTCKKKAAVLVLPGGG